MRKNVFLLVLLLSGWVLAAEPLEAWEQFMEQERLMLGQLEDARRELPEDVFGELLSEQARWYEQREQSARYTSHLASLDDMDEAEYWYALAVHNRARSEWISAWRFTHSPAAAELDDWEGWWLDGEGGHLHVTRTGPDSFEFSISVVRGPTFHLGELDGSARIDGRSAEFRITPEGTEDETVLRFSRDGPFLVLEGENTWYWHGVRAYFDGRYLRGSAATDD